MSRKVTLLILFLLLIPCFGLLASDSSYKPIVRKGVIDLANWQPASDGPIELSGEWEFHWQKLVPATKSKSKSNEFLTRYVEIPGDWKAHSTKNPNIKTTGFASYRLLIKNLPKSIHLALDFPNIQSAYTIYIDGKVLQRCGTVGRSRQSTTAAICTQSPGFYTNKSDIELLFHIANYHHARGGFWQSIRLGEYLEVAGNNQLKMALDLFLTGAIFMIGLYHFGLFSLRRRVRSPLYFGFCCLLIAVRSCLTNTYFIYEVFPAFDYSTYTRLVYLTLCLPVITLSLFFNALFPKEFSSFFLKIINLLALGLTLLTLLTPSHIFSAYLAIYQIVIGIAALNILYVILLAFYRKKEGAYIILFGGLIMFASVVNDILHSRAMIDTTFVISFGLFLFFFSQAYVISNRFAIAFRMKEKLTADLEKKVRVKTDAIQDLLNNTEQGIFSFDSSFQIQPFTSRKAITIFREQIVEKNALALMFPAEPEKYKEFLEVVFESKGKIGLVRDVLPKEMIQDGNCYEITYNWIPPQKSSSARILIILTDISLKRELEEMLEKDQTNHRRIIRISEDKTGFLRFYNSVMTRADEVHQLINEDPQQIDVFSLTRSFHTIKGGSASYGFNRAPQVAHEVESALEKLWQPTTKRLEDLLEELDHKIIKFQQVLHEEMNEVREIVPKQLLQASRSNYYDISETKTRKIEYLLREKVKSNKELFKAVNDLKKQPVRNLINKCASDATTLAFQLGKQVEVYFKGENTQIIHKKFTHFFPNLTHLVNNAIDHGIEPPRIRHKNGKPGCGFLKITVSLNNRCLNISFQDDGQGISPATVRQIAISKGLLSETDANSLSDNELIMLTTNPKYTSKNQPDIISGRGVGLAAVAASVQELEGDLEITSKPGEGTRINISIPIDW